MQPHYSVVGYGYQTSTFSYALAVCAGTNIYRTIRSTSQAVRLLNPLDYSVSGC